MKPSYELRLLKAALDAVEEGVILLDSELRARFMNRAVRKLWRVPDALAEGQPHYSELLNDVHKTHAYGVPPEELGAYIAHRLAAVTAGDTSPTDIPVNDGRVIRARCTVLPGGGRLLTYSDVTDLVRAAREMHRLATEDSLTGILNRRRFMEIADAEWVKYLRYQSPLSLISFDLDRFKSVNDRYGHGIGDQLLIRFTQICCEEKRGPDVLARVGGEEFVILTPETSLVEAFNLAERIRRRAEMEPLLLRDGRVRWTVSVGLAEAASSMSGLQDLLK